MVSVEGTKHFGAACRQAAEEEHILQMDQVKDRCRAKGRRRNPEEGVFWPSDFLGRDLESARIFTYGYNADVVTDLFQSSNSNNIYEHTMTMAVRLKRELEHHNVGLAMHLQRPYMANW
jgi:hypothetical protein